MPPRERARSVWESMGPYLIGRGGYGKPLYRADYRLAAPIDLPPGHCVSNGSLWGIFEAALWFFVSYYVDLRGRDARASSIFHYVRGLYGISQNRETQSAHKIRLSA